MKALVIGGAGFVGGYLVDHLQDSCKWSVCVTKLKQETIAIQNAAVRDLDILDQPAVDNLIGELQPDVVFHLAAQSSVAYSWQNPQLTIDVNVKGAVNVLEALRRTKCKARLLLIGSGEQYGLVDYAKGPVGESTPSNAQNIYAVTKLCQESIGLLYAKAYGMDVIAVRAFNHVGPRQTSQFVVADFASQIADIEKGRKAPVLEVGNLEAARDFTDVRDIVAAYALLAQKGRRGEVYNVGSGKAVKISEILRILVSMSAAPIEVKVEPGKFRPIDIPLIEADTQKLRAHTGWQPAVPLQQTLRDTLEYWRQK